MSLTTSIYIPRVLAHNTKEFVKRIFESNLLGKVKSVQFRKLRKHKAAIIHFSNKCCISSEHVDLCRAIEAGRSCKISVSPTEYWVCLKYFGTKVEQAKKIDSLEKKLNSVHQVVCQLISGLYNKETQNCAYRLERDILDGGYGMMDYSISALDNTSKWDFSPTTRQGDDCERRIENLEQIVQNLMETFQDK